MKQSIHELTDDIIVLKIMKLLQMQGKTEKELERALGLTTGAFARWKYLNGKSYRKYIPQIADYLNITENYLLNKENDNPKTEDLSITEMRLVEMFRKMNDKEKKSIISTAECFMYSKKYNLEETET